MTLRDGRHFVGMMRSFDQYGMRPGRLATPTCPNRVPILLGDFTCWKSPIPFRADSSAVSCENLIFACAPPLGVLCV